MILRRLAVKGWRCFGEPFVLESFVDGINLISGPNGSGKSSLFWALARALFDRHGTGGKDLDRVRTWDRDLSPEVAVDFEVRGEAWRIEKTFLAGAASRLSRLDGDAPTLYAEGDTADENLRDLLGSPGVRRGVSKPEHWGLPQLLWSPQGALEVPDLGPKVLDAIHQSLGGHLGTGSGLGAAVEALNSEYFSPTGRELRGDRAPAIAGLRGEAEELRRQEAKEDRLLLEFEESQRVLEDRRTRLGQLAQDTELEREKLAREEARVKEYRALAHAVEVQSKDAEAEELRFHSLNEQIRRILESQKDISSCEARIRTAVENLAPMRQAAEDATAGEDRARLALEAIRARRSEVQDAHSSATAARDFLEATRQLSEVDDQLTAHRSLDEELVRTREKRNLLNAPSMDEVEEIRILGQRLRDAEVRLDAALISLEITPEGDTSIEVLRAEEPGTCTIGAGESGIVRGAPAVEIRIDGLGRIRASGPVGDVDSLRDEIRDLGHDLTQRTQSYGTNDIEELAGRARRREQLGQNVVNLTEKLEANLGGQSPDDLVQRLTSCRDRRRALLEGVPGWADVAPDASALESDAARIEAAWVQEVDAGEGALDLARSGAAEARDNLTRAEEALKTAEAQLSEYQGRLQDLRLHDGLDDEERTRLADAAAIKHRAADAQAREAREALEAFGEDPQPTRDRQREKVDRSDERIRDLELGVKGSQVKLAGMVGAKSRHRDLARTQEQLAATDARITREERRMEAVSLLRRLFLEEEQGRMEAVVAPVERTAGELLRRITGPRLGALTLGEGFRPASVQPRAIREGVVPALDDLSGGEQEQVHFAVRIALASFLAAEERQLVVLDDVLAYTDRARYRHLVGILQELSEHLQVVILACHPERYDGLVAKEFDLDSLRG